MPGNDTRRIVLAAFPGAQILDISGPLEVFATATREVTERDPRALPPYRVEVVATRSGPLPTSSGIEVVARRSVKRVQGRIDTLIVAGGVGTEDAVNDDVLIGWIAKTGPRARRLASVCTGAFLLAHAGLLEGRRATTHWRSCDLLARLYPNVHVESDPIFVRDGRVYSSAGVCAGMDLALALVEEDLGREIALAVAQRLVIFLKRPGGQSQFSVQLAAQAAEREPLRDLQAWIADHPNTDLSVESLARRSGMSPRNFARVFAAEVGATPARYVERTRVEAARRHLEESDAPVEQVARDCGFGTPETMRRSFIRTLNVSPTDYRGRFRSPSEQHRGAKDSLRAAKRRAS